MGNIWSSEAAKINRVTGRTASDCDENNVDDESTIAELRALLKTEKERNAQLTRRYHMLMNAPSPDEIRTAMKRLDYRDKHFHIAVAGTTGVGKSALVNALQGLHPHQQGSAQEGTTETTMEIARYEAGDELVFYDIPGAGTQRIARWGYFKEQGLYIMNAIILVVGNRIIDTDISIIENCAQLRVVVFVVRSRSDDTITDIIKQVEEELEEDEQRIRERYLCEKASGFQLMPENSKSSDYDWSQSINRYHGGEFCGRARFYEYPKKEVKGRNRKKKQSSLAAFSRDDLKRFEVTRRVREFQSKTLSTIAEAMTKAYADVGRELPCEDVYELIFLVNKRSLYKWVKSGQCDEYTLDEPILSSTVARVSAKWEQSRAESHNPC